MHKPEKNELIELEIEDIGFEGHGIGKTGSRFAVFVPNTVPGDRVVAQVYKTRRNLAEARLVEIKQRSVYRVNPECGHFGLCSGCKIQHISYEHQLEVKRNNVVNAFTRIGGFNSITVPPVLGTEKHFFYRNKLEFSFSSNRWLTEEDINKDDSEKSFALGFHKPGFIDKVIDINRCLLQSDISNKILNLTKDFFKQKKTSIYSTKTQSGFLRFLIIRQSANTNDILINLITSTEDGELMRGYTDHMMKNLLGEESGHQFDINSISIIHSISSSRANVAQADKYFVLAGKGFLEEKIKDINFKISPFSFFQTNTRQCEKLFDAVVRISDFKKEDNILDLYCGCGAISLFISGEVNSVLGVEMSADSAKSAGENASLNKITNCEFVSYDVKDFLKSILRGKTNFKTFDTVILDPPRSGIHHKSAEYLMQIKPAKIIYVSCNPTTQARDVRLLSEKYSITQMQPVDMFPHTFHIENVLRLDLIV